MRSRSATKIFTIVLSILCIVQGGWIAGHYPFAPELSRVVQKYALEGGGVVYVIESNSGGATVPLTYRYYLNAALDGDEVILNTLGESDNAFLVTRDANAKVLVEPKRLIISVTDSVYQFTTPISWNAEGQSSFVDVWLDARPDSRNM